jgi:chromosome segregation ATPase
MPEASHETWLTWAALTTTALAVLAAFASLQASRSATQVQLAAARQADQRAYYQTSAIKEHLFTLNRDLLASLRLSENKNPKAQRFLGDKIKEYEGKISRYGKDKNDLQKGAADLQKEVESYQQKNSSFTLTVMLLLIAILCSAVGALIRKKILWLLGLILGGWGIFYFVLGLIR